MCFGAEFVGASGGAVPPDPVALLASPKMAACWKEFRPHFDFVVIDSPPVLALTDATILCSLVNGILLVAASGTTPRGGLVRARKILEAAGGRILGMAVNKLDTRRPDLRVLNYSYNYQ